MPQRGRPSRATRSREELARAVVVVLAQARHDAGMTRARLAEKSGISLNTIAKIEQAAVTDPGFAVVATLAMALDLPLERLIRRAHEVVTSVGRGVAPSGAANTRESEP